MNISKKAWWLFRFPLLFAVLSISTPCFSQVQRIDSSYINKLIDKSFNNKLDTFSRLTFADSAVKVSSKAKDKILLAKSLFNKGKLLRNFKRNPEAIPYIKNALAIYIELEEKEKEAICYQEISDAYHLSNNYKESLNWRFKRLKIREELGDTFQLVRAQLGVAVMYWRLGDFDNSEKFYKLSLDYSKPSRDTGAITAALNTLGALNFSEGRLITALEYYKEIQNYKLIETSPKRYVLVTNNIGLIYQESGEYDKALENFEEGLRFSKEQEYTTGMVYSYVNIGQSYLLQEEYEQALSFFQKAFDIRIKDTGYTGIAVNYRFLGDAYLGLKAYTKAIENYEQSVYWCKHVDSKFQLVKSQYSLANAYYSIGKTTAARSLLVEALALSLSKSFKDTAKKCYFLLSEIETQRGDYEKALRYFKHGNSIKDSIFSEKNSKQIAEIQTRYETEKQQIAFEKIKNEKQKKEYRIRIQNIVIIGGIFIFIILVAFVVQRHKQQQKLLRSKEQLKKATEFKDKLFTIIGHDLRGPIGAISSIISLVIEEGVAKESMQRLLKASKDSSIATLNLLENLLAWAKNQQGNVEYDPIEISIHELILRSVDLLQESANNKEINLTVNIESDIEIYADYNMVDTTLRNIISNAIKFTFRKGEITITAITKDSHAHIIVEDNGTGMTEEELDQILNHKLHFSTRGTTGEKGSGIGLQLCFDFINYNNGEYFIESTKDKGTKFTFTVPLTLSQIRSSQT